MKKNHLIIVFGLLLAACGGSNKISQSTELNPTNNPKGVQGSVVSAETVNDKVIAESKKDFSTAGDVGALMDYLASDELQGRETGSEGIEKAARFISNRFEHDHIAPYFSTYRDTLPGYETGVAFNIVGVLPGIDPKLSKEIVVVGAHYDHIGQLSKVNGDSIANGANDNASGTAVVLELARYFGLSNSNKRTIIFALFTAEEKGLLGSKHLAERLKSENIDLYAMLNFEMVGVPMIGKDHALYLTGYEQSNLADISNRYAGKKLVGFLPKAKEYNLFRRSDNAAFHDVFNVPSQTYSSFDFTNFDEYHKVGDENSKMDYSHMAKMVNEIIPMVKGIINSPIKELKYN